MYIYFFNITQTSFVKTARKDCYHKLKVTSCLVMTSDTEQTLTYVPLWPPEVFAARLDKARNPTGRAVIVTMY